MEVICPLLQELKVHEEILRRLKEAYNKNLREYEQLSTIVRIPAMTSEFWKLIRQQKNDKAYDAWQKDGIKKMAEWKVFDYKSQTDFLTKLVA